MFEARLEDVAQLTGELDYGDAWKLNKKATADPEFRKKVRAILNDYDDAVEMGDEGDMEAAGQKLKELVKECV